jgi:membrane associated rhomboid family serine protease
VEQPSERILKIRTWPFTVFSLVMLVPIILIIADPTPRSTGQRWGTVFFILIGATFIFLIPKIIATPELMLSSDGFETRNWFGIRTFVRWLDIDKIEDFSVGYGPNLMFTAIPTKSYQHKNRGRIPNIAGIKYQLFRSIILEHWENAKQRQAQQQANQLLIQTETVDADKAFELAELLARSADPRQALEWYQRAGHAGNDQARLQYGVRQGDEEGVRWVQQLAEGSDALAREAKTHIPGLLIGLARKTSAGLLDKPLPTTAQTGLEQYRQMAINGSREVQRDLGIRLQQDFAPSFQKEAQKWLEWAARRGDIEAIETLHPLERPAWLHRLPHVLGVWVLLALLIAVVAREFMIGGFKPSVALLQAFGATSFDALQRGETWRVLTAPLLHGDPRHIMYNGFALFLFGQILERRTGLTSLLTCFVITGITGSLASSFLGPHNVVSVGASGAIFGLMGFLITHGITNNNDWRKQLQAYAPLVLINLFGAVFVAHVDHFAHAGGFLGGLVLGLLWSHPPMPVRTALLTLSVLALGTGGIFTLLRQPGLSLLDSVGNTVGTYCVVLSDGPKPELIPTSLTPLEAPYGVRLVPCPSK